MTLALEAHCVQAGCPLLESGLCLEGFDAPEECPQYRIGTPTGAADPRVVAASEVPEEAEGSSTATASEAAPSRAAIAYIGGDQGLRMTEANAVAAASPTTVILVAGEVKAGKTTLIVELFAQFLRGPFEGWSFAGSKTLRALDLFHKTARLSSGLDSAQTERTQPDDMRLLHLEIANYERRVSLLASDVRGEFFEEVANGSDVELSVPLADRADLCILVLDGERLEDPADRDLAVWRAGLMLGGLAEPGGLSKSVPLLIVVSKSDLLSASARREAKDAIELGVAKFARDRNFDVTYLELSARPRDTGLDPTNIDLLLKWIVQARATDKEFFSPDRTSGRISWRSKEAGS